MFTSIAIIGRPNVGKSTLFNKLTKSRKAIVSNYSGLTKDRNYGYITFGDHKTLIIDTGGIAQDETILKEDIAEQAWIAAEESSLIIFLLDGSENLNKEDLDILTRLRKLNKNFITVLNKIDKNSDSLLKVDLHKKGINDFFEISAEHSRNISDLRTYIKDSLPKEKYESPEGKKIAVQGVGHVGEYLVGHLAKEGAVITITDIHDDILKRVSKQYNCEVVSPDNIYDVDMDIYAPCALGSTVNSNTISRMNCSIIAGAANNQLEDEFLHGQELMDKGIIYAPDYIINAGGVMNCYAEVHQISSEEVMKMAENIYHTTLDVINTSQKENTPTFLIANRKAEDRLKIINANK